MRHGLTIGEIAKWFQSHYKLELDLEVIEMEGYNPLNGPGYGWRSRAILGKSESEYHHPDCTPNLPRFCFV